MRRLVLAWAGRLAARVRSSRLVAVLAALFLLDLLVPDLVPFADEIVLGLLTLLAGRWADRRRKDVP